MITKEARNIAILLEIKETCEQIKATDNKNYIREFKQWLRELASDYRVNNGLVH